MPDETLVCVECGATFPFAEGEQTFYAARQLSVPRRCKPCRDKRRLARDIAQTVPSYDHAFDDRAWHGLEGAEAAPLDDEDDRGRRGSR